MGAYMKGKNNRKYSFQVVAEKRVDNISKAIEVLTRLSNRKNYDYNKDQINQIFIYIRMQLDISEKNFNKPKFKDSFNIKYLYIFILYVLK